LLLLHRGTAKVLKIKGEVTVAAVIEATQRSPSRAEKVLAQLREEVKVQGQYCDSEALALIIQAGLSIRHYNLLRWGALKQNVDLYPSYKRILVARKKCRPSNIALTESTAIIPMQDLLDHTITRLSESLRDLFLHRSSHGSPLATSNSTPTLTLVLSWGMDGSSNQAKYKQTFVDETVTMEGSLFVVSIIPLRIVVTESVEIVWQNPNPNSVNSCRPLSLLYAKETPDFIRQ
jgi:hypothetical protein